MINEVKMVGGRLYVRKLGDTTEDWKLKSTEEDVKNCGNCNDSCLIISDKSVVLCRQIGKTILTEAVLDCHSSTDKIEDCEEQEEPSDQELLEILQEENNELLQTLEQANNAESIALRSAELAIIKNGEYKNIIMALEQKLKQRDTEIFQLNTRIFNYALVTASAKATEAMAKLGITATEEESTTDKIIDAADKFRSKTDIEPDNIYLGRYDLKCLYGESHISIKDDSRFDGMNIICVDQDHHLSCS